MNRLTGKSTKDSQRFSLCIFFATIICCMVYLLMRGSMISFSGDAADIWGSITTFYSKDRRPSYVMYKGFASMFPYVWMYQLSVLFHTNEFFFVMLYHAVLFAYLVTFGIPNFIEELTGHQARTWQRILCGIVLFWYWDRYGAISQLMVDLPSCAYFIMAIHFASHISRNTGWKQYAISGMSALMSGLCANISGQYSAAGLLVSAYAILQLRRGKSQVEDKRTLWRSYVVQATMILALMYTPRLLNVWFNAAVVQPLIEQGAWIPSGAAWFQRGLINGLPNLRQLYGQLLLDPRGEAIVMELYGEEAGRRFLELAAKGGYAWSIRDYFSAFFRQPDDFIMLYLDTFMGMLSDDGGNGDIRTLLLGYTMEYLTLSTAVLNIKHLGDLFQNKMLLVLGTLASVLASIVVTSYEPRFLLGLQCMLFGTALLGPILPELYRTICSKYKSLKTNGLNAVTEMPWAIVGWIAFCLFCFGYFGMIRSASGLGVNLLYHW